MRIFSQILFGWNIRLRGNLLTKIPIGIYKQQFPLAALIPASLELITTSYRRCPEYPQLWSHGKKINRNSIFSHEIEQKILRSREFWNILVNFEISLGIRSRKIFNFPGIFFNSLRRREFLYKFPQTPNFYNKFTRVWSNISSHFEDF